MYRQINNAGMCQTMKPSLLMMNLNLIEKNIFGKSSLVKDWSNLLETLGKSKFSCVKNPAADVKR